MPKSGTPLKAKVREGLVVGADGDLILVAMTTAHGRELNLYVY
jgi:hypothetical protein